MIQLVIGGVRSGKSRYAQNQAFDSAKEVFYIATAEALDDEMKRRIHHHQQDRPSHWHTVEEPLELAKTINQYSHPNHFILVDCLTLWLSNILFDKQGGVQSELFQSETDALFDLLNGFNHHVLFVSNEVGTGVIGADAMTRRFIDEAGFLNQKIAQLSDQVVFITAGLVQTLK